MGDEAEEYRKFVPREVLRLDAVVGEIHGNQDEADLGLRLRLGNESKVKDFSRAAGDGFNGLPPFAFIPGLSPSLFRSSSAAADRRLCRARHPWSL